MKRLLSILLLLSLGVTLFAQQMSVASFSALPTDLDARVNYPKQDLNGRTAALIKVESVEKGFAFDVGQLGVVDVVHDRVAETWVYVPHGVRRITIQHPQLGTIRNYEFPIPVEQACVYSLVLTSGRVSTIIEEDDGGRFFVLTIEPQEATVVIDEGSPIPTSNGFISQFLPYGKHTYSVSAPLYTSMGGEVTIADSDVEQTIQLQPTFGYISVSSTPVARIQINGVDVGQTPFTTSQLPYGSHMVRLTATGYEAIERTVTLSEPAATVSLSETMVSLYSTVSLEAAMQGATITVNGERKGVGSWRGNLVAGEYLVTSTLDGHRESKQRIVVERDSPLAVTLDAPVPMYGKLRVNASQPRITVSLDGAVLGTAPKIFQEVLVGTHTVTYSGEGYVDKSEQITIEEGKIAQVDVVLTTKTTVADKPKATVEPTKKKEPSYTLLLAEVGYHPSQLSYGLMVGWVRTNGFYIKALSDFNTLDATSLTCNDQCVLSDGTAAYFYRDVQQAHTAVTAGYVRRLADWLYLYAGGGYGTLSLQWRTEADEWATNTDHTFTGIAADAGAIVRMGAFSLSAGASTTCFNFYELNVGIGVAF